MGFQAIVTKYIGPTNHRGSRIRATAAAGSVTVSYDHSINPDGNHRQAAIAVAKKFGWHGRFVGGGMPGSDGNVYVCDDDRYGNDSFTIDQVD